MKQISVIIGEPGKMPRQVKISPTVENLQRIVGGYIGIVTFPKSYLLPEGYAVICNEEGRLRDLPPTYYGFRGKIIFAGVDGDELTDFPLSWEGFMTRLYGKYFS